MNFLFFFFNFDDLYFWISMYIRKYSHTKIYKIIDSFSFFHKYFKFSLFTFYTPFNFSSRCFSEYNHPTNIFQTQTPSQIHIWIDKVVTLTMETFRQTSPFTLFISRIANSPTFESRNQNKSGWTSNDFSDDFSRRYVRGKPPNRTSDIYEMDSCSRTRFKNNLFHYSFRVWVCRIRKRYIPKIETVFVKTEKVLLRTLKGSSMRKMLFMCIYGSWP